MHSHGVCLAYIVVKIKRREEKEVRIKKTFLQLRPINLQTIDLLKITVDDVKNSEPSQ